MNNLDSMNTKEAAEYIGVSLGTVRKYVHEEGLPVLRFPGRRKWIFRKDMVDQWMEERSKPVLLYPAEQQDYGKLRILKP
ncbi:helix-turn-helix domain-containing protein [Domibacillus tundrae]|uniref:helix-turn-helix domain-containing protein n=1 Tax=Domibacillus tundrae TaxID=1587527 RepID=UPI000617E134|nr:helix-turn-helix domain-containing protein [Domibacillus tundrae]